MIHLMKKNISLMALLILAAAVMLQLSGCKEGEDPGPDGNDGPDVEISNGILVDSEGFSLYFFTRDANGESACEGGCLSNWPIFHADDIELGAGLNSSDFGSIDRGGGEMQTTYKGWPLYYYAADSDAGDTNGDGVGTIWYVANPDYDLMIADAQLVGHDGENYLDDYTVGEGMTQYFTDAEGNTIYRYVNDTKDTNNYGNDATWPIFFVEIDQLPSGMNPDDFGQIDVSGEPQLTFKGWPLYYFGQDNTRGDNKGVSVPSPGVWPIINNSTMEAE